mgnify:CR=1 FL=1
MLDQCIAQTFLFSLIISLYMPDLCNDQATLYYVCSVCVQRSVQVICKICPKSAGLHEFFGRFVFIIVLFEGTSPAHCIELKKCLNFDGMCRQGVNLLGLGKKSWAQHFQSL